MLMQRKRRDPVLARSELLKAATKLFARFGPERTSLAAVGEGAGVSRGLPAYFFGNKESLYCAVLKHATEQVRKCVLSTAQTQSVDVPIEEVLKSIIDAYLDFLDANPDAVRLLQWESLKLPDRRVRAPGGLFDDAVVLVDGALQRSGYTRVNARFLLLSIVGMCFFPFGTVSTFKRKPKMLSLYKKHVLEIVLDGIRGKR